MNIRVPSLPSVTHTGVKGAVAPSRQPPPINKSLPLSMRLFSSLSHLLCTVVHSSLSSPLPPLLPSHPLPLSSRFVTDMSSTTLHATTLSDAPAPAPTNALDPWHLYNDQVRASVPSLVGWTIQFTDTANTNKEGVEAEQCSMCKRIAIEPVVHEGIFVCKRHLSSEALQGPSVFRLDRMHWKMWCQHRTVQCSACSQRCTIGLECAELIRHVKEDCTQPCQGGCNLQVSYKDWIQHPPLCAVQEILCPYYKFLKDRQNIFIERGVCIPVKCNWRGKRFELERHLRDTKCSQLLCLAESLWPLVQHRGNLQSHSNRGDLQSPSNPLLHVDLPCIRVGDILDVKDTQDKWYEGTILKISEDDIYIHFNGWSRKWDQWFDKNSDKLAKRGTYTSVPRFFSSSVHPTLYYKNMGERKRVFRYLILADERYVRVSDIRALYGWNPMTVKSCLTSLPSYTQIDVCLPNPNTTFSGYQPGVAITAEGLRSLMAHAHKRIELNLEYKQFLQSEVLPILENKIPIPSDWMKKPLNPSLLRMYVRGFDPRSSSSETDTPAAKKPKLEVKQPTSEESCRNTGNMSPCYD
jgi:hypothetical protein